MINGKSKFAYLHIDDCNSIVSLFLTDKAEDIDGCIRCQLPPPEGGGLW